MLVEQNQINFHSDDGTIVDGVKDYSRSVAEMIGLGSDTEFLQAGVSIASLLWVFLLLILFFFLCMGVTFVDKQVSILLLLD